MAVEAPHNVRDHDRPPILVTGATGYVGGRLVTRLLENGFRVRAAARSLEKLQHRPWAQHPGVTGVRMDALEPDQVRAALSGCRVAYYLIHSMDKKGGDFAETDRRAAEIFRDAAADAGVERIIYLGGLGDEHDDLSQHLSSRAEVGEILGSSSTPTTTLRASLIIGAGSASFEIVRHLVEKLPIMITPRWVRNRTQPIGIANVLDYLVACVDDPRVLGQTFDIGGPDIVSYGGMMQTYARVAGLKRRIMIPVPFLTPGLSSHWIHFVTPVTAELAKPLVRGLRNETLVDPEKDLHRLFPDLELTSLDNATRQALKRHQELDVETFWSDAGVLPEPGALYPGDPPWVGTAYLDRREIVLDADPGAVWEPIRRIGGKNGYYYGNLLWAIRGALDLLFGGPGLRRGRRHPESLRVGDALDFWRVIKVEEPTHLRLVAEMRLPGRAHLDFRLEEHATSTRLRQTASFEPRGLVGRLYWWSVWPLHHFVFNGMLRGIAEASGRSILSGPSRIRSRGHGPSPEGCTS